MAIRTNQAILNADCLLRVLKHSTPEVVCKVSRTNKSINALVNRYIEHLPQPHFSILIHIDTHAETIRCRLEEPGNKDNEWGNEIEELNYESDNLRSDDNSDSDWLDEEGHWTKHEPFGPTGSSPTHKVVHEFAGLEKLVTSFHYVLFKRCRIHVVGTAESQLLDTVVEKVGKLGVEKMALGFGVAEEKAFIVVNFTPDDVLKFLGHFRKGFRNAEASEDDEGAYFDLDYFLLMRDASIFLELNSQISTALSFTERFLKRVRNEDGTVAYFAAVFHVPTESSGAFAADCDNFISRVRQFATVKADVETPSARVEEIVLEGEHKGAFDIAFDNSGGRIEFAHRILDL